MKRSGAEIDQQSQPKSRGCEIVERLGFKFGDESGSSFDFKYDFLINQKVGTELSYANFFIHYGQWYLASEGNPPQSEFIGKRMFVHTLQESGT